MKEQNLTCDIEDLLTHTGKVETVNVAVIFDHDQEDGKSKVEPYIEQKKIEMCDSCWKFMLKNRKYIYAYGAMGHNKYYLTGR
jgi:hypothetical protein